MNPNISASQNATQFLTLLNEFKKKVETESKCQICWDLSIAPIICSLCGNNVGCSEVEKGSTGFRQYLSLDRSLSQSSPGWILNQINEPSCSNTSAIKPSPAPSSTPKSVIKPYSVIFNCPSRALAGALNHNNQPTCFKTPTIKSDAMPSDSPSFYSQKPNTTSDIQILPMIPPTSPPVNNQVKTRFLPGEAHNLCHTSIFCSYLFFADILA
uniref:Uncharacterized protein n=1 Tax=Ditylenchus dipsaci TaxID=166011 RepID=A0A915DEC0_9BILA